MKSQASERATWGIRADVGGGGGTHTVRAGTVAGDGDGDDAPGEKGRRRRIGLV